MNNISSDNDAAFHFIRDEPADTDFLGSHGRLATSIATVISQTRDLKVIGLLGSWGAGKSTVLRLLQQSLRDLDKKTGESTFCFFYDAWLHQNDPPRRAFLETLIDYLINEKQTKQEVWQRKLDALNRKTEESETTSTPTLTASGKLIAFSLLFWPISFSLLGHDWFEAAFKEKAHLHDKIPVIVGGALFLLPIIILFCTYLSWRPTWRIFSRKFVHATNWKTHKEPHRDDSIFSMFLNKEVQTQRNRITRAPDPSTIEFQEFFREIIGTVKGEKKRFIFVIDNLDRLPEIDAVAMWGTIRSFFLGARGSVSALKPEDMPVVILPIDEQAICRMYNVSHAPEDAQMLARSFMDKTFDLTFHVPRPVLSDWNKYLEAQMVKVFGPNMDSKWPFIAGRFYERYLIIQSDPNVTPRTVNTLINAIAVLWLQWSNRGVTFAAVAYYCTFRDMINVNILQAIQSQLAPISDLDADWQRSIAAIHYGASPDEAGQILIEHPLRKAISDNDPDAFSALRSIPSFERVLLRILDAFASGNVSLDVIFRAAIILHNLGEIQEPWFNDAWHQLHKAFKLSAQWQKFGDEEAQGVAALVGHCGSAEYGPFVGALDEKIAALTGATLNDQAFHAAFNSAWGAVLDASKSGDFPLISVRIPGDEKVFLNVAVACCENERLTKKLEARITPEALVHELCLCLADRTRAATVEMKFLALLRLDRSFAWAEAVMASIAICRDQNATYPGMASALLILGKLSSSDSNVKAQIAPLINGGQLSTRLNEAYPHQLRSVLARSIVLLLVNSSYNFPIPNNGNWEAILEADIEFSSLLNETFLQFSGQNDTNFLFEAAKINQALTTIIRAVIRLRLQVKDLGPLSIGQILTDLPHYLRCVDDALRDSFILELSEYSTFWEELSTRPLDGNPLTVFRTLMNEVDETGVKTRATLIAMLNEVESAKWSSAISNQTEPLVIANDLARRPDSSFEIGQNLYDGLQFLICDILRSANSNIRERWFETTKFLSSNSRQTLLRNMRDAILGASSVAQLPFLLSSGGKLLLESGGFFDKADDCVRLIVTPLADSADGAKWLTEHSDIVSEWVNAAKHATRGFLWERLASLVVDKKADYADTLRNLIESWFANENFENKSTAAPVT